MTVFYRRWRPQTLAEVVGQEHVTRTLLHALEAGRVAHAYLFSGPRGTGKTSTGRILAKAVNCLNSGKGEPCNTCSLCQAITQGQALDVIEVDAASNRRIDDVRDLREKVAYAPSQARYKVYIIDEVHMLTADASNALLKTLEEPPAYVLFILCTTEPHEVLPTILSRCQRFDFRRLPQEAIVSRLAHICEQEGIQAEAAALRLIARAATGSLRDAENLLEQQVNYYGPRVGVGQVKELLGLEASQRGRELVRYVVARDLKGGLGLLHQLHVEGVDLRALQRGMVENLRGLLLVKGGSPEAVEATPEEVREMKELAGRTGLDFLARATRLFASLDLGQDYSPLPLELALVECIGAEEPRAVPSQELRPPSREEAEARPHAPPARRVLEEAAVAPPRPEAPVAESPRPEGPLTLEYVRQQWRGFINSLRGEGSRGTLDSLLRSACEPVKLEGDTLELGFYHNFHMEKIEDPKYRFLIERKLRDVFGVPLKVRCSLIGRKFRPPAEEPVVKAALEMGARIVEEEV